MTNHRSFASRIGHACAALAAAFALAAPALAAEGYPLKPGRLIIPFGTGGSTDIIGRVFAAKFSEMWGQTLVVDNRAGSGGVVGTEIAARSGADGYTLLVYGINQTITPAMYKKLPFDNMRDFALISMYATMPNMLIVHPGVPAKTLPEFLSVVRANPGKFRYASSGIGASPHLTMELLKTVSKIDILHIPYKSAGQAYIDLAGGQVQAFIANLPGALLHSRVGRVRAIAVTSAKRAEQVPDVPTFMESGIPDFEVTVWQGIAVPVATPRRIIDHLHATMMKVLEAPDLKQRFFDQGVMAAPTSREQFLGYVKTERVRWAKVIKDSGTTAD